MGRSLIYFDANVLIRLIEGDAVVRAPLEARLSETRDPGRVLVTSQLTRLECRCKPIRDANAALLAVYDGYFAAADVLVCPINEAIMDLATNLRAALNVKTPDAIQLATAIANHCSVFVTGDQGLKRCTDIPIEIL